MKNPTSTNNPIIQITPTDLGKIINKNEADIAQIIAAIKAKRAKEKSRLHQQYKLTALSDRDIDKILNAEEENSVCENCTGEPCCKTSNCYYRPVICVEGGRVWVPMTYCQYGERQLLKRECSKAQIPESFVGKTFVDYDITSANSEAVSIAKWYTTEKPAKSLYLYGNTGTGKTLLAIVIAQEFILAYKQVIFGDMPTLLDDIKQTFNGKGSAREIVDRYCDCDLLILDDLGAGQATEWNIGILYQIINRRYNSGKRMIITSNFDLAGLEERLASKDRFSAKRIISRLSEMCIQAFLGTTDRRKLK